MTVSWALHTAYITSQSSLVHRWWQLMHLTGTLFFLICVFVFVNLFLCICISEFVYVCLYLCFVFVFLYFCICVFVFMYLNFCICICEFVFMYLYLCIYICVFVFVFFCLKYAAVFETCFLYSTETTAIENNNKFETPHIITDY